MIYLTADFGSTYTKLTAIDVENKSIIGVSRAFTTIETDVREGYQNALTALEESCGKLNFEKIYASSSAAGGFKVVSVGLVPDLTLKASKLAATNAGAKILATYSYELNDDEILEIDSIVPEVILLCGGIDGGNKQVVLHNAKKLASMKNYVHIIYAGNKSISQDVRDIFEGTNKTFETCENVMPSFDKLNIEPTKSAMRTFFIQNIVKAKGLDKIQKIMSGDIVPTPLAVFNAVKLLSIGTEDYAGLGELMAYDIGGATSDVYSMAEGEPKGTKTFLQGMKEPFDKRTVEGDLGVRYSMESLLKEGTVSRISKNSGVSESDIEGYLKKCKADPSHIAENGTFEKKIDDELASMSVQISGTRHCGFVEKVFTHSGEIFMQTGKDLSDVKFILGAGGSVINSENPKEVLKRGTFNLEEYNILKPKNPEYLLDKKNISASMGLLSSYEPDIALAIMKKEFVKI